MAQFIPAAGPSNPEFASLQDGIAIVATGDTHAAITSGQYVYVKNHSTLLDGLYVATANIAANASLTTSNLTADSNGGLNALSEQIATLLSKNVLTATTINETTTADGYILTNISAETRFIISAKCEGYSVIYYKRANNTWGLKIVNVGTLQPVTNTAVSVDVLLVREEYM